MLLGAVYAMLSLSFDEYVELVHKLRGVLVKLDLGKVEEVLGGVLDEEFEYGG